MHILSLVLLILAMLLFLLAGCNVPSNRINLVPLGLAAWVLTILLQHA